MHCTQISTQAAGHVFLERRLRFARHVGGRRPRPGGRWSSGGTSGSQNHQQGHDTPETRRQVLWGEALRVEVLDLQ